MTSPAERYVQHRRRVDLAANFPRLEAFAAELDFELDPFQQEACQALEQGIGVLVCAPTGAGKTVVGEFAVYLALGSAVRLKCFYTTPIKALSNQKYRDLVERYGVDHVGLLTGDNAINGDAAVVVMTTEVLRNMLYAGSPALEGLAYVVMDEVHYLADRFRGAVWEEVIIHLPESVTLVSLSATVSNAEEFADWLITVRGQTAVVVSEHRPVPLWQHMMVGKRLFDLFHNAEDAHRHTVNPDLVKYVRETLRRTGSDRSHRPVRGRSRHTPPRPAIVERLDREGLLPAIVFVFSRAGTESAVEQCLIAGLHLTTPMERSEIRALVEKKVQRLNPEDLNVLGYWGWLDGLERGLAFHHAGMLPTFKEVVEELFVRGLVKTVFATETLSLGMNMPARCVVLERLVKYNGESHAGLTPGEYTQLTGRAGRRGIDVEGHAVVIWNPEVDPRTVAGLASTRTYPLRSSFRPSYNMAVNLVGNLGASAARELLESSFAQYQADRSVVGLAQQIRRNMELMETYTAEISCHAGDFEEYFRLRVAIADKERSSRKGAAAQRHAAAMISVRRLRAGDVIVVPTGRHAGLAVVLDPGIGVHGDPRPLVVTSDRWAGRVPAADFTDPVEPVAHLRVSTNVNYRSPRQRRDLASSLRNLGLDLSGAPRAKRVRARADDELTQWRAQMRDHACHACPEREEHARWAERRRRLERETEALQGKVASRTGSLARIFDRVCGLLTDRGYLMSSGEVTEAGQTLARMWTESDLLVAECLRRGVWDGLNPAELAAAVSIVVFESRGEMDEAMAVPRGAVTTSINATMALWRDLEAEESVRGLPTTRQPDCGFVWPIYRWVRGEALARVLASTVGMDTSLTAGDFVRWSRQVIDLLSQFVEAPGTCAQVRSTAKKTITLISRGVLSADL